MEFYYCLFQTEYNILFFSRVKNWKHVSVIGAWRDVKHDFALNQKKYCVKITLIKYSFSKMFEKYKCSTNKKQPSSIIGKYSLLYFYVNYY